ncbi:MAG: hypothetical protein IPP59_09335 [Betaproteobacteria bacterium]|nr:hypothetical protein [Candidatus Dechloromonas phosphorivorans]
MAGEDEGRNCTPGFLRRRTFPDWLSIAIVATLAVAREGLKTVIFLYGVAQEGDLRALLVGALAGFAGAGATACLAAKSLAETQHPACSSASPPSCCSSTRLGLLIAAVVLRISAGSTAAAARSSLGSSLLIDGTTKGGKLIAISPATAPARPWATCSSGPPAGCRAARLAEKWSWLSKSSISTQQTDRQTPGP